MHHRTLPLLLTESEITKYNALSQEQRMSLFRKMEVIKEAGEALPGKKHLTMQNIGHRRNISASTVNDWVNRYRKDGISGLIDRRLDRRTSR